MVIIKEIRGNIFDSRCYALVNPVNTHGVMGAGLALQFKRKFKSNYFNYNEHCKRSNVQPGDIITFEENDNIIFNLVTKDHWKDPSKLEWIEQGLDSLIAACNQYKVETLAIPKIGSGLGKLDWESVRKLIYYKLESLNMRIELYV